MDFQGVCYIRVSLGEDLGHAEGMSCCRREVFVPSTPRKNRPAEEQSVTDKVSDQYGNMPRSRSFSFGKDSEGLWERDGKPFLEKLGFLDGCSELKLLFNILELLGVVG